MKWASVFLLLWRSSDALRITSRPIPSQAFVRDAEKKHARVAMLAVPTLMALSSQEGNMAHAVSWLSHQPMNEQLAFFSTAAIVEAAATLPRLGPRFTLKEGVLPGNLRPQVRRRSTRWKMEWVAERCSWPPYF